MSWFPEETVSYYFTCTHTIASYLLSGQSLGNFGLIDVYKSERDAVKAKAPCDTCFVELRLLKENLKNVTVEVLYAMAPSKYLVPCLKAVYPLSYIEEQHRKADDEAAMSCCPKKGA